MDTITKQLEVLFNDTAKTGARVLAGVQARRLIREKMTELQKLAARPKKESAPAA